MKIGIDIMGGDFAPQNTVYGAILALNELPKNIELVLFGKTKEIITELKKHNIHHDAFHIVDCSEIINMEEHATKAFRKKEIQVLLKGLTI